MAQKKEGSRAADAAEERFRALVENALDNIMLLDQHGIVLYVSPSVERIIGCKPDALQGFDSFEWIHPEDRGQARDVFERTVAGPGSAHYAQFRVRHADRSWRFIEAVGQNLLQNPAVGAIVVNSRDVTEAKEAHRKIQLLAAALNAAANGVLITDRGGTILAANPALCAMTGYSAVDVIGKNPRIFKSGEHSQKFFVELWETILSGAVWRGEMVNRRKDGSLYHEEQTITPLRLETPEISHFISIKTDISEKKQSEEQLVHLDKMEALGRLAAGVVHDFKNLLAGISGYSQMVMQELAPGSDARRHLGEIIRAVNKASQLTKTLLTFTGNQELQFKVVDVNALVLQSGTMLRQSVGRDVDLTIETGSEACAVSVDAAQLESTLANLVANASDALPAGGKVIIQTGAVHLTHAVKHAHGEIPPGSYVVISVSDTGSGMNEEVLSHIFEPFFTTKAGDRRTGLGLAIVYGTVRQSGGHIQVITHLNLGSKFVIYLPRVPAVGSPRQFQGQ